MWRRNIWQASSATTAEISEAEALGATREFAAILAKTPEYQAFDQAQLRLRRDPAAAWSGPGVAEAPAGKAGLIEVSKTGAGGADAHV